MIPYESSKKDFNNDGLITKLENDKYLKDNKLNTTEFILLDDRYLKECDRLNTSLDYCDYKKFEENFQKNDIIMQYFLANKAIPHTVLK